MVRSGRTPKRACAPPRAAREAGDHLVEDEQRPGGVAERAQRLEEAGLRRDAAHVPRHRLDEHRRQLVVVAGDGLADRGEIVVVDHDRPCHDRGGDAGRGRDPERREPGACRGEEGVGMAVVAARELEHARAAGEGAREPQRRHRRLGARGDEPHLLDRWHRIDDLGGKLDLTLGRGAEARPVERGRAHRLDRLGIGMTEDQRPPRLHPVEQASSVGGLEVGAAATDDEERLVDADRTHRADGRVDAARDQLLRARPQLAAYNQAESSFAQ